MLNEISEQLKMIETIQKKWMLKAQYNDTLILPEYIKSAVEQVEEKDRSRALLILMSQMQSMLIKPKESALNPKLTDLPRLDFDVVDLEYQRNIVHLINLCNEYYLAEMSVIHFLLDCNLVIDPQTYFTCRNLRDLPNTYAPWLGWELKISDEHLQEGLTEHNWGQFDHKQLVYMFKQLRANQPDNVAKILAVHFKKENAKVRLALLETMLSDLSINDREFLLSLCEDKSSKVIELSLRYLAKIGCYESVVDQDDKLKMALDDLVLNIEQKKNKENSIVPKKLKNETQRSIRTDQIRDVPCPDIAQKLGMTLDELIENWSIADFRQSDNYAFFNNVMRYANTEQQSLLYVAITKYHFDKKNKNSKNQDSQHLLSELIDHVDADTISQCHAWIFNKTVQHSFTSLVKINNQVLKTCTFKELKATWGWAQLNEDINEILKENSYISQRASEIELTTLGLFLPNAVAIQCLEHFLKIGVLPSDTALIALNLNKQLKK